MNYSQNGLQLTEQFEGCRLTSYLDQAGVPTIGYGHTQGICIGMTCTQEQAQTWLLRDVQVAVAEINAAVKVPLTQCQFDALVDFTFNLGVGNFQHSTLLRLLNASDYHGASSEILKWNKAGGIVRDGLVRRRQAEANLFNQGAAC